MTSISHTLFENTRCRSGELLNRHLVAAIDLRRQVGEAQRNMSPDCVPIQKLLDQVAEAVAGYSDRISERSAVFGPVAQTHRAAVEHPLSESADDEAQVAAVATALAAFGDSAREAIDEAAASGDANACDIFAELSRGIDYHLWLVESHLNRSMALWHRDDRPRDPAARAVMRGRLAPMRLRDPRQLGKGGA